MLSNSTASHVESAVLPLESKVDLSADVFTQKRLESMGPSRSLVDEETFSYQHDNSSLSTKEIGHLSPNRIFNPNPGLIRSPKLSSYSDDASGHVWRATDGDLASFSLDSKDKEKDARSLTPTHSLAGDLPRSWPLDEESRDRNTWTDLMKKGNDQEMFKMQSWPENGLDDDARGGSLLPVSKASSPDRFRQQDPSSFPPRIGGAPGDTQELDEYFRKMAITPRSPNRPSGFDPSESLLGTGHALPPSPQRQGLPPPHFEHDDMRQQGQGQRFSSSYGHDGLLHGSQGSHRNPMMTAPEPSPVVSGFDGFVYKVQFKRKHRNFLRSSAVEKPLNTGDFVIVEADRGEDLGVICDVLPMPVFFREGGSLFGTRDGMGRVAATEKHLGATQGGIAPGTGVKHILRHALPQEYSLLPIKMAEEEAILEVCRERALGVYLLPMALVDAEYQFDRHKLTVYYESNKRIDFRELVRDIFTIYKTRIWMEHVSYSFRPHDFASRALSTGVPILPSDGPTSTPQLSLSSPSPSASPTGVQQHGRPQGSGYFQYGSGAQTSPYSALYGQRPAASGYVQSSRYTDGYSYDSGHGSPISPPLSTGYAHTTTYSHLYGGDVTASIRQQQQHQQQQQIQAQVQAQARSQMMQGPMYSGNHGSLAGAYSRNPYATQGELFTDDSHHAHSPVYGSADMYVSYQPLQYPSTPSAASPPPQSSPTHQGQSFNPPR